MNRIIFSTGNTQKISKAQSIARQYGIEIVALDHKVDEVQSEDTDYVARRKAETAYKIVQEPVVISDDAWLIHGLNGFPGTYAKSVNTWFSTDDYLRLTKDLSDRNVSLIQTLVYQDEKIQKVFSHETRGVLLTEATGEHGAPIQKIVSFEDDQLASVSEIMGNNGHYPGNSTVQAWHDFATWLKEYQS